MHSTLLFTFPRLSSSLAAWSRKSPLMPPPSISSALSWLACGRVRGGGMWAGLQEQDTAWSSTRGSMQVSSSLSPLGLVSTLGSRVANHSSTQPASNMRAYSLLPAKRTSTATSKSVVGSRSVSKCLLWPLLLASTKAFICFVASLGFVKSTARV